MPNVRIILCLRQEILEALDAEIEKMNLGNRKRSAFIEDTLCTRLGLKRFGAPLIGVNSPEVKENG